VPIPLPTPALQEVVFVEVQFIVDESPFAIDEGVAVTVTVEKFKVVFPSPFPYKLHRGGFVALFIQVLSELTVHAG
jgi:hypothetical protein